MKEIISCLAEFASHWLAEAQYLTSQRQLRVRGPDQAEGQRGEWAQRALRPVDVWRTPGQDNACTSLLHNEWFSQVWSHYTDAGTGHEVWTYYLTPGYTQVRPLHASWQPLCVLRWRWAPGRAAWLTSARSSLTRTTPWLRPESGHALRWDIETS